MCFGQLRELFRQQPGQQHVPALFLRLVEDRGKMRHRLRRAQHRLVQPGAGIAREIQHDVFMQRHSPTSRHRLP